MNPRKSVVFLVALAAIFVLSAALAEAVSVTPKLMSGQLRVIHPDGKIITITQSGQPLDLKDGTKIEMVAGSAVLQIAGYRVKMQSGEQIALRVAPRTSAVSLNVLAGAVKVESPKQSWMLSTGETAMLEVGSGAHPANMARTPGANRTDMARGHAGTSSAANTSPSGDNSSMSGAAMTPTPNMNNLVVREKVNADATTTNVVQNETASPGETTADLAFPITNSPRSRLSAPLSRDLVAPLLTVSTPIPSPVQVKYASPSAP